VTSPSTITSRRHPLVLKCRQLAMGRRDDGDVLLDGEHLVSEALDAGVRISALLVGDPGTALAKRAAGAGADVHRAASDVLDAASPVRSSATIVAIGRWATATLEDAVTGRPGLIVALVDVQDPGNVGSVIRSSDAFGAAAVIAGGATADPGGWKALRGAMGSTFHLPVARGPVGAVFAEARRTGARVVATTVDDGEPLGTVALGETTIVLLGNEGAGLPDAVVNQAQHRMHIPMRRGVNSLNVAVAAALILYEASRARRPRTTPA
jgi:RNA methyltransferase, TrmH family